MRKLLLLAACLCAMPLAACDTLSTGTIPTPSTYAQMTKADEQAAVGAELSYKLWRQTVEVGINAGLIKGQLAAKVAGLDNQLYAALVVVEKAYATGNADTLGAALSGFNDTLSAARKSLPGGGN